MSTANANLGTSRRISIYVEGSKLGRDFVQMKSFSARRVYAQGVDEHLGDSVERPWQRCTGAEGDFEIDESDAKYCNDLEQALQDAERSGQQPDVRIVERTLSNSGTVSKTTFPNVTLQPQTNASGKNEKVTRRYSFRSSAPTGE